MRESACANCGATEGLQQHHIVPLCYGGENRLSNIVLLCPKCHKGAHHGHEWSNGNGGRPKKEPPVGYEAVLDRYFKNEIGTQEVIRLLNLENYRIASYWWVREYRESHNIPKGYRNNVDLRQAKRK